MPEGHTVHRLAARHRALFAGRRVAVTSPQGRFAAGAALLSGRVLRDTDASRRHWLDLRGPAACEVLDAAEVDALVARLGPDPLRADADPGRAYARIRRSDKPLAALLLDQSVVAGPGVIYVTEVLFRAGLPPTTPGRELTPEAWQGIWTDLVELMREGVERGRIDTVHSRHTPEAMGRPPRVDRHGGEVYVYRRAGQSCLVCGDGVRTGVLAGRNSYWCATCQRK
ncbi:MAG: DNA glycosylase [Actinobacteria bacterium 13_2_20CM_2_72_6]|nr:MAG: DNA glycosylase [Actinobacteria bacterium 13_2_20CM_2_72_6]